MLAHSTIKMRVILGDIDDSAVSVSYKIQPSGTAISQMQRQSMRKQFRILFKKANETLNHLWEQNGDAND
jgi:hypothetical protein